MAEPGEPVAGRVQRGQVQAVAQVDAAVGPQDQPAADDLEPAVGGERRVGRAVGQEAPDATVEIQVPDQHRASSRVDAERVDARFRLSVSVTASRAPIRDSP